MTKLTVDLTKDMANIDPIRSARLIKEGNYKKVEQLEKEKTISLGTLKKRLQEKAMAEINMEQKTETLIEKLRELKATRNDNRSKEIRKSPTQSMRKYIFQKTGGKCHICGGNLDKGWHADHVLPHASGGQDSVENFLGSCSVCNMARWYFCPEEIRLILKLGRIAQTEIRKGTKRGKFIAQKYIAEEEQRRKRKIIIKSQYVQWQS